MFASRVGEVQLVFARHGETTLNIGKQFRGRADPPLTAHGEEQALDLARRLSGRNAIAIYSSPRLRAQQTARPLASALGREPITAPAIDDFDFGKWTGRTAEEVSGESPALYTQWLKATERVVFPGGEAVDDALKRIRAFLDEMRTRHASQTVVAVTHDAVVRCVVCLALDAPLAAYHRIAVDLTSTTELTIGDSIRLHWVNRV